MPTPEKNQVQYVGSSTVNASNKTSITAPLPTGYIEGDLLIASVNSRSGTAPISAPSGWKSIDNTEINGFRVSTWYKFAESNETNPTFSNSIGSSFLICAITAYRNVKAVRETNETRYNTNQRTFTAPNVTTAYSNTLLLLVNAIDYEANATGPQGFQTAYSYKGSYLGVQCYYKYMYQNKQQSTNLTTTYDASVSGSTRYIILEPFSNTVPTPLKDFERGSVVSFAGRQWQVLEPSTGYTFCLSSIGNRIFDTITTVFNPSTSGSLAAYLNTTYYISLTANEKSVVLDHMWGNGGNSSTGGNKENNSTVKAKIGLISYSEWQKYAKYYNGKVAGNLNIIDSLPSSTWTRTFDNSITDYVWVASSNLGGSPPDGTKATHPAVYINPNTLVAPDGTLIYNQTPTLSLTSPSNNQTLSEGNKLSVEGTATEIDLGNVLTVKYKINNGTPQALQSGVSDGSTPLSFAKTLTFRNKRLRDGTTDVTGADLAENVDHTLTVWAEDDQGGKSTEVVRKFRVIHNRAPIISDQDRNLGTIKITPSITYTVADPEENPFTVTEKINGSTLRSYSGVPNRQETLTIPANKWLMLEPGVPHTLTITAADEQGKSSSRTFTFTRQVDEILFEGLQVPMETDIAAERILLTPDWQIPLGAEVRVEVCNNGFDAEPAWEDCTIPAKMGRGYAFLNTVKTAEKWGVNFRVRIQKGTATSEASLSGIGGAYDVHLPL